MKKENALIIPINLKKIIWLHSLLNSIRSCDALGFDIVLLVSDEAEKKIINKFFLNFLDLKFKKISYLDISMYLRSISNNQLLIDNYNNNNMKCIVNLKKILGMYWAKDKYNNLCVIDCDTVFVEGGESDLFFNLISNYEKRKYFGGGGKEGDIYHKIMRSCASFFSKEDSVRLEELTKKFTLYPWFFDAPFYRSKDLYDFFTYISDVSGGLENFLLKINWNSFEHIIFIYYRLLKGGSSLVDLSAIANDKIPEHLKQVEINKIYYNFDYSPVWIRLSESISGDLNSNPNGFSMIYHVDRL